MVKKRQQKRTDEQSMEYALAFSSAAGVGVRYGVGCKVVVKS